MHVPSHLIVPCRPLLTAIDAGERGKTAWARTRTSRRCGSLGNRWSLRGVLGGAAKLSGKRWLMGHSCYCTEPMQLYDEDDGDAATMVGAGRHQIGHVGIGGRESCVTGMCSYTIISSRVGAQPSTGCSNETSPGVSRRCMKRSPQEWSAMPRWSSSYC